MRRHRLLLTPVTILLALGAAGPAMAAEWNVGVTDFEFTPPERNIAVGDTVTWSFTDGGHTTTAVRGQSESWNSSFQDAGGTFRRTFTRPGRFQYVCTPHKSFMKGVIEVGEDEETDTLGAFRTRRSGGTVSINFTLNEPAVVTYKLKGPSRRTVERGRLAAGRHSFKVKRLKPGQYRGVLTLTDDFDKKITPRNAFTVA